MFDVPVLLLLAVVLGGVAQRATGMGFALASAPLAIIALGPLQGVIMMNLFGIPAAALALVLMWKSIEWRMVGIMVFPCIVGVWLGVGFLSRIEPAALEVGLGFFLVIAVLVTLRTPPLPQSRSLVVPAVVTGFSAGFMNAVASIGGPPLVVFRNLRKWSPETFTPTIQPLLITMSGGSLLVKSITGTVVLPTFDDLGWLALALALAAGIFLGQMVAKKLSVSLASKAITGIAIVGSTVTLIRGLLVLVFG